MERFTKMPTSILDDDKLTSHEKIVWLKLRNLQEEGCTVYSLAQAARLLGLPERGVQHAAKALIKAGVVAKNEHTYEIGGAL